MRRRCALAALPDARAANHCGTVFVGCPAESRRILRAERKTMSRPPHGRLSSRKPNDKIAEIRQARSRTVKRPHHKTPMPNRNNRDSNTRKWSPQEYRRSISFLNARRSGPEWWLQVSSATFRRFSLPDTQWICLNSRRMTNSARGPRRPTRRRLRLLKFRPTLPRSTACHLVPARRICLSESDAAES